MHNYVGSKFSVFSYWLNLYSQKFIYDFRWLNQEAELEGNNMEMRESIQKPEELKEELKYLLSINPIDAEFDKMEPQLAKKWVICYKTSLRAWIVLLL